MNRQAFNERSIRSKTLEYLVVIVEEKGNRQSVEEPKGKEKFFRPTDPGAKFSQTSHATIQINSVAEILKKDQSIISV